MTRPTCLSLLLCDLVLEDPRTRNKTYVNCFTGLAASLIPAVHPRMFIVASLTHLGESSDVRFLVRGPQDKVAMEVTGKIDTPSAEEVYDLVVELQSVPLHAHGMYFVDLEIGGELVASRRFTVMPPQAT